MIFLKIFTKYSTHHSLSANTGFKSLGQKKNICVFPVTSPKNLG